jgi:predicted GNAT family N-acyltransferase
MQHEQDISQATSFRNIAFSEKVQKCLDRALKLDIEFSPASWAEAQPLLAKARGEMALASEALIKVLHDHNPEILRIARFVDGVSERTALFCYLPLNEAGAVAVANGSFDGKSPKTDWICGAGVEPVAIYLWLVYMPGSLGQSIGVIAKAFDALAPHGCPVFSKAVNPHAERLNRSMGFLEAKQFYPECAPELLVVFPQKRAESSRRKPRLKVAIARDLSDIMKVFAVRSATYIAEQYCHYEEEFDGNDFCATHFLGTVDGDAAGCIRMRFFAGFAKIERLAVRTEYRNSRLAFELARAAIRHCRLKGYTVIYGHSRLDLVRFWRMFGFKVRTDGRDFGFANVRYVEIVCEEPKLPDALTLEAEPLVIIRPEGAWDVPGPLDRSESEKDPARRSMLLSRTRTVRGQLVAR